jgi:hypothetical protein
MAVNIRQRHKGASLIVQIMHAGQQVLDRRRLISVRATMLGQNVRRSSTSPAMLLLAGGLGFAAGHFTKRQASTPSNTERPRGSHNKIFGRVLKLIALARTLSRASLSAVMDPSVQSGLLPGQPPHRDLVRLQRPETTADKTLR